jgi:hypothetical protein
VSVPLRAVTERGHLGRGTTGLHERLSCGHVIDAEPKRARRRRCWKCARGEALPTLVLPSRAMPPAGRPPADKVANVAADTTINIRCTSQRKAKLEAKAQRAAFKSLSAWLLHLAETAAEPTEAPATAPGSTPGR